MENTLNIRESQTNFPQAGFINLLEFLLSDIYMYLKIPVNISRKPNTIHFLQQSQTQNENKKYMLFIV